MLTRLLFVLLMAISAWATWTGLRARLGDLGQRRNDLPLDHLGRRFRRLVTEVLLQVRVMRNRPLVGVLHALVMWGFLAFAWVSVRHLWAGLAGLDQASSPGGAYRASVAVWAVLVTVGILGLAFRRFVLRPAALGAWSWTSAGVTALIVVLMVSYLLDWSGAFGHASRAWQGNWWAHALALLAFPPLIVRSKHLHLVLGPVAVFFRPATTSRMRPIDLGPENFEKETPDLGLVELGQLPWKDVLDLYACVECGRCTDACPAHRSGGSLSPKALVLQMQAGLRAGGTTIVGTPEEVAGGAAWVTEDDLMQCYACGACEEACPVGIEHVGRKILDLRHGAVNNERLENPRAHRAFAKMKKAPHNPWGLPGAVRTKVIGDEKFPLFAAGDEVLFWMGCGISYDPHGQRVAAAMRQVLDASGVAWGVLEQETCCGEPARRLGNEALFQELSAKLVASLQRCGARTIVTCCPHCSVMLDGEYRDLPDYAALDVRVMHHTEFIAGMLDQLPLVPNGGSAVAYHDPCNLARGRGITAEPRRILEACGARLLEPAERGRSTLCCGAGGGQLFISDETRETSAQTRANLLRFDQLMEAKPQQIAAACPYCPIMLRDAAQARGTDIPILDIAEVVASHLAQAKEELMTGEDLVVGGETYRYRPDDNAFPYLGPDGERYRRHENGGGLVARGARVAPTVHVGPLTRVFGNADLGDRVRLTGRAQVGGSVRATGSVIFCAQVRVTKGEFGGSGIIGPRGTSGGWPAAKRLAS